MEILKFLLPSKTPLPNEEEEILVVWCFLFKGIKLLVRIVNSHTTLSLTLCSAMLFFRPRAAEKGRKTYQQLAFIANISILIALLWYKGS